MMGGLVGALLGALLTEAGGGGGGGGDMAKTRWQRVRYAGHQPVMVGIVGIIATLNLLCKLAQLDLIQVMLLDDA